MKKTFMLWSEEEESIVKNNWVKHGSEYTRILIFKHNAKLGIYPDRSKIAIRHKALGLGLSRKENARKESRIANILIQNKMKAIYNYRRNIRDREYALVPKHLIKVGQV